MKRTLCAAALLGLATIGFSQVQTLAIAFNGNLYEVSNTTGTGVLLGNTGLTGTNSLAVKNGVYRTIDQNGDLYRLAGTIPTFEAHMNLGGATDVRAIAFDASESLWMVVDGGGAAPDVLWRGDPDTGVSTLVGPMGSSSIQGLAITAEDVMYAWDVSTTNTGGLRTVDRLTGATTDLNPAAPGDSTVQDLYRFGIAVRGGRDSLFSIDRTTGAKTLIGTGGYADARGWARNEFFRSAIGLVVRLGRVNAGTVSSLRQRDGNRLEICKFIVPNQTVPPINVEVTGDVPAPSVTGQIGMCMVARMTTTGSFRLTLDMLNTTTGQFDAPFNFTIGTTDQFFGRGFDGSTHLDANGNFTSRFRIAPVGPVATASWCASIDLLTFNVERTN